MVVSSCFEVLILKRLEEILERHLQTSIKDRKKLWIWVPTVARGEGVMAWEISGKSASQSPSRMVDGRPSSKDSFLH